jgi:drug/metabolite transporter (DMT)-like permease
MFAWFVLILLGAIWGASYMFIKIGVAEIPPFTFVLGRTLLASLALLMMMRLRGEKFPRGKNVWGVLMLVGLTNGVIPYTLITWGETHITSGLAAILTAMNPLFTFILAHFMTHDERITPAKSVGMAIAFLGVVVLFIPEIQQGVRLELLGMFAVVGAALSYAFATLVAHKFMHGLSPIVSAAGQLGTAALMMIPLSLAFDNPFALRPTFLPIAALITLALLGTAFAYILYYWLVKNTGATRTSLVTYLIPFTGVLWGASILSEPIEWEAIVGLVLLIAGVALVNRKPGSSNQVVAVPVEGE